MSTEGGNVPLEVSFTPSEGGSDATFLWEFGDGQTSSEREPVHTFEDAGELTVRLTVSKGDSAVSSAQVIRTFPGQAGWVAFEPAVLDLESGESVALTATAFDILGNPVPNAGITFSADPDAGSLSEDGTFTAGPNVGDFPGAVTASFERQEATGEGAVAAHISLGRLDTVAIEPAGIMLRVNERVDFTVIARDRQGHVLPEATVEWFPLRPVDSVLAGGEFVAGSTPTAEAQDLIRVLITVGGETKVATISGSISPGILDSVGVRLTPSIAFVGSEVTLEAIGFDRFGNELPLDSVEWDLVSPDYGDLTPGGVFTPSGATPSVTGPLVTATGRVGGIEQVIDVELIVLPGPAVSISIVQDGDSVTVGSGDPLSVQVTDEWGNEITGVNLVWEANSGGNVTFDGIFVAGFETGDFTDAVTVTLPAGEAGNTGDLIASADLHIRDRSSDLLAVEVSSQTDAGIILIDFITGEIRSLADKLDTDDGIELAPAWWPDGKRLAYASDVSGTFQVYDIDIETEEVRQLVDAPDGSTMPQISPDGTKIAFVVLAEAGWQVYVADIPVAAGDGSIEPVTLESATKISADDSIQSLLPWWSPDGSTIAFNTSRSRTDVDIRVAPSDGSGEPRIVGREGLSVFGWSDDGEHLLSIDVQAQTENTLLVVDPVSGDIVGFIPLPFDAFMASWAPDNTEAAVVDRFAGGLWLIDADGTSLRQAVGSNFVPRRTAWRPVPIDAAAVLAEEPGPELQLQ